MRNPFNYRFGLPSPFYDNEAGFFTPFSPIDLFASSEPGVWYDPSDLTTLFQDTAGTTPVTAPSQTVGLMLDKSKGLTLGSDTIVNGDFASSSNWTLSTWTISGGKLNGSAVTGGSAEQSGAIASGKWYRVTMDVACITGVRLRIGRSFEIMAQFNVTNGTSATITGYFLAKSAVFSVEADGAAFNGTIDNISVKELPGNHATQATAASRPTYGVVPLGGRRNLLTWSEDLTDSVWATTFVTKATTSYLETTTLAEHSVEQVVSLSGNVVATFEINSLGRDVVRLALGTSSGTYGLTYTFSTQATSALGTALTVLSVTVLPDGWHRIVIRSNAGANRFRVQATDNATTNYAGDVTKGVRSRNAQLETGSTATAYQKVTTQYDVTEAGVQSLSYLSFDGVDDFMLTGPITPGVDKAQVFAGVRKLADGSKMLTEFSVDAANNAGAFFFTAGTDTGVLGSQNGYTSLSRGSAAASVNQTAQVVAAAIDTAVLTVTHDIAGSLSTIRRNAVAGNSATAFKGAGSFLTYPLYLGMRAGSTLPFSGNLYSLITRFGANLPAGQITNTEIWVGGKTGINIANNISTTIFARDDTSVLDRANSIIERRA